MILERAVNNCSTGKKVGYTPPPPLLQKITYLKQKGREKRPQELIDLLVLGG